MKASCSKSPAPILSVVIGTLNRKAQIVAAIDSIEAHTTVPHRIYVTDAGSTDGTVAYLKKRADAVVRPVFVGKRLGQARAYNEIFFSIDTPYTAWLSDDNTVINDGLDVAVDILQRDSRVGMVALKVRDVEGPFVDAPYVGGVSEFGILNVNQGMLRTEFLHSLGGFSEQFHLYGLDPDLTARVLLAGKDVVYTKRVVIHHARNWPNRDTPEFRDMMEKQKAYQIKYREKFNGYFPESNFRRIMKFGWRFMQSKFSERFHINAPDKILGVLPRDWHNIFLAHNIRLLDPVLSAGRPYHLRQRLPRRWRRRSPLRAGHI